MRQTYFADERIIVDAVKILEQNLSRDDLMSGYTNLKEADVLNLLSNEFAYTFIRESKKTLLQNTNLLQFENYGMA